MGGGRKRSQRKKSDKHEGDQSDGITETAINFAGQYDDVQGDEPLVHVAEVADLDTPPTPPSSPYFDNTIGQALGPEESASAIVMLPKVPIVPLERSPTLSNDDVNNITFMQQVKARPLAYSAEGLLTGDRRYGPLCLSSMRPVKPRYIQPTCPCPSPRAKPVLTVTISEPSIDAATSAASSCAIL
jgi:hypothetical protein